MDHIIISVGAAGASLAAVIIATFRRRTVVTSNLQVELDLAVEANKRLEAELGKVRSELAAALQKVTPELLAAYAREAVDYGEQKGGSPRQRFLAATSYIGLRDDADNGVRDWSDAVRATAIEAEVRRRKAAK